jgi:hypothetical protein
MVELRQNSNLIHYSQATTGSQDEDRSKRPTKGRRAPLLLVPLVQQSESNTNRQLRKLLAFGAGRFEVAQIVGRA